MKNKELGKKISRFFKVFFICFLALSIPGLLIVNAVQAGAYRELKQTVLDLEKKQEALIEENKKLITDIGVLSNSDRIERIAENELGMRKAETDEIVRVEMSAVKKQKQDGMK